MKMTIEFEQGRYWVTVRIGDITDENAIIGYDDVMQTYFFQSGLTVMETGDPLHWLGQRRGEFLSFEVLKQYMEHLGMKIVKMELDI